jgi:hypothetical protein
MIRKLELDLDGTCPSYCDSDENQVGACLSTPTYQKQRDQGHIELGSLLCEMWKRDLNMDVSFVQTHSEVSERWLRYWHALFPPPGWANTNGCFAHAMTDLLRALDRPESEPEPEFPKLTRSTRLHRIDIRQYWHTIGSLSINREGTGGIVAFKTTNEHGTWHFGAPPNAEGCCTSTDEVSRYSKNH